MSWLIQFKETGEFLSGNPKLGFRSKTISNAARYSNTKKTFLPKGSVFVDCYDLAKDLEEEVLMLHNVILEQDNQPVG
jgi:hypothetical protein